MVNEKCKIIVQEQPRSVYDTFILPSEVFLNSQVVAMALLILNKPFEREIRIIRTKKIWTVTDYKFFTKIDIGDGKYDCWRGILRGGTKLYSSTHAHLCHVGEGDGLAVGHLHQCGTQLVKVGSAGHTA